MDKFFEELLKMVQGGTIFIQGQLPDYINQLLMFNFWSKIVIMLFLFFLGTLLLVVAYIVYKQDALESPLFVVPLVFGIFLFLGFFIATPKLIIDCIKIKMAPKVYIVDYLIEKIKK